MKLYLQPPAKMVVEIDGIRGYLDTVEEVTYINLKNTLFGLGFTRLDHGYTVINWERVRFIMSKIERALGVLDSNVKLTKRDFIHEEVFRMLADQSNTADAHDFKATVCNLISNKSFAIFKEQPRHDATTDLTPQVFEHEQFGKIRALPIDGEPWFVGKDVAIALGYQNPHDALGKHVDNEDKGAAKCDTLGGTQTMTVINEGGLYSLAVRSNMPKAKEFTRWLTHDVSISIRKHGFYVADNVKVEQDQSPISDFERGQALTQLAKAARDNDIRRKIVMEAANLLAGKQIF
jgi:prophage antirepressor-like protein